MAFMFDPSTFVATMFNQMQGLLNGYAQKAYAALRDVLAAPLLAAIVLYYTLMGISIAYGWIDLNMRNLVKSVIKVTLIYSFAMSWDFFVVHFVDLVTGVMNVVSSAAMNIDNPGFHDASSLGDSIQTALNHVWAMAEYYWKNASWHKPVQLIYGFAELFFGCLVLVPACGYLLVSQALLALLFGLAPLCVSFMLFKPTQPFFNRWVSEITGQVMSVIFVSAALGMTLMMLTWVFPDSVDGIDPALLLATIFTCLIAFAILKQAAGLGRSIGEGAAVFCQYSALNQAAAAGSLIAARVALLTQKGSSGLGRGAGALRQGAQATGQALARWRHRYTGGDA